MIEQSSIEQPEIHDPRRRGKFQTVRARESRVTVRAFHEFVAKSGAPLVRRTAQLRSPLQPQLPSVRASYNDGKSIVEAKRRQNVERKSLRVFGTNPLKHGLWVAFHGILQDRRQRRPRILPIRIDEARQQCLLADVAAGEVEAALHFQVCVRFDLLREEFAEDGLLGEVLRSDYNRIVAIEAARRTETRPA